MKHTLKSTVVSYSLMEQLGEGLNSIVYKAVRSDPFDHLNHTVALKILKSKNLVEIWKNEFASLTEVVCKHCVRVYGFDWVDGKPALVLEYVNGISLRQLCLAGPVPPPIAGEILAQIQVGLLSLKEKGLCHGDLSPNNIMIDESGLVRLLDFGWANNLHGRVQTTFAFAAPELLDGGTPNFQTDLYSLGSIEKMLTQNNSSRLSVDPNDRTVFEQPSLEANRAKLAKRVRHVREHQNRFRQMATRSIVFTKKVPLPILRIAAVLFTLIVLPHSASFAEHADKWSAVKIRTTEWTKLRLDGRDLGFAPKDLLVSAHQKHTLIWQTKTQRGRLQIELSPGQEKRLYDKDLHP